MRGFEPDSRRAAVREAPRYFSGRRFLRQVGTRALQERGNRCQPRLWRFDCYWKVVPMYEYRCRGCGKSFEQLRRMSDADRDLECPECRSRSVERQLSTFATGACSPAAGSRFT